MGDRYILLFEDEAQRLLLYRWLVHAGVARHDIVSTKLPAGTGGASHVLREYPRQVKEHRRKANHHACKLVVMIDGDNLSVAGRIAQLDERLSESAQERRGADERIAVLVPRRHVETWLKFFSGEVVDEVFDAKAATRREDIPNACQAAGLAMCAWFRDVEVEGCLEALVLSRREVERVSSARVRLVGAP